MGSQRGEVSNVAKARTNKETKANALDKITLLPAPLPLIAEMAAKAGELLDHSILAFLALPLVVRSLDVHPAETALWPRVIAARLRQAQEFGLDEAVFEATPAEVCAFMESVTRMTPPDDEGIMVGVFANAMYRMLGAMGYPLATLPDTLARGKTVSIEAARSYQQIARAIRTLQLARHQEVPPTSEWGMGGGR